MSYPAREAFERLNVRRHTVHRVYMALQPPRLHFTAPKAVKVAGLVDELHMSPRDVIQALSLLTEQGYLVEHSRDPRGVRSLTLAYALDERAA